MDFTSRRSCGCETGALRFEPRARRSDRSGARASFLQQFVDRSLHCLVSCAGAATHIITDKIFSTIRRISGDVTIETLNILYRSIVAYRDIFFWRRRNLAGYEIYDDP